MKLRSGQENEEVPELEWNEAERRAINTFRR